MQGIKLEAVITAAQELFARYGFSKTTIDEIARDSHVAKSTIYTHFRSKDDIIEEVIQREGRALFAELTTSVEKINDPAEKIRIYITTRMKCIRQKINYYSAISDDFLEHHSFIEKARQKNLEDEVTMVRAILVEGVEKGIFALRDPGLTAFVLISAMKALDFPLKNGVRRPETRESIDHFIELLFDGIKKR